MAKVSTNKKADKIDYLHPNGMPRISEEQKRINEEEQKKPVSKQALEEADGHHICTEACLGNRSHKNS
ncbi:MAG: hypothetical protein JSS86_14805 [Cyanobacteria bacterium SZAS LIN-2]|nr:hypothetical protein [Cyanobacteria bacterium SZAS LIN-3]MBS1997588.1 hypothetical protein [Cyanobacteria bacterium SZAS LIN-2]MBS2006203.1 hypothetical protein [Cyanobacteria bacterium SZAS TMP-1]